MIKVMDSLGIYGTYINIIKVMYKNYIANIMLDGETFKAFPLKLGRI